MNMISDFKVILKRLLDNCKDGKIPFEAVTDSKGEILNVFAFKEVIESLEKDLWCYNSEKAESLGFSEFYKDNNAIWGEIFFLLEKLEDFVLNMFDYFETDYLVELSKEDFAKIEKCYLCFRVLLLKACGIYESVLCLLKDGRVDSAFSLWRSMFEIKIIAQMLEKNPQEVSIALFDSLENSVDEKEYEWCKRISDFQKKKGRVFIVDLIDYVDIKKDGTDFEYNNYKTSSNLLHISKNSLISTTGDYSDLDLDLAKKYILQSSRGIETVVNNLVYSFSRICLSFFSLFNGKKNDFPIYDYDILLLNIFLHSFQRYMIDKVQKVVDKKELVMWYITVK